MKISMDRETHANDGSVSKDHYEEALTKSEATDGSCPRPTQEARQWQVLVL
jgi:hypothetical protein